MSRLMRDPVRKVKSWMRPLFLAVNTMEPFEVTMFSRAQGISMSATA